MTESQKRRSAKSIRQMTREHRLNVWRVSDKCPVCGNKRGYSQSNPNGLEMNCGDQETCGFSEFFGTRFIHESGYGNVRFEVLDSNNEIREGWGYSPSDSELSHMKTNRKLAKERKLRMIENKDKIYLNLGDEIYCKKINDTSGIKPCEKCEWCMGTGREKNGMIFSKCTYPLGVVA